MRQPPEDLRVCQEEKIEERCFVATLLWRTAKGRAAAEQKLRGYSSRLGVELVARSALGFCVSFSRRLLFVIEFAQVC